MERVEERLKVLPHWRHRKERPARLAAQAGAWVCAASEVGEPEEREEGAGGARLESGLVGAHSLARAASLSEHCCSAPPSTTSSSSASSALFNGESSEWGRLGALPAACWPASR